MLICSAREKIREYVDEMPAGRLSTHSFYDLKKHVEPYEKFWIKNSYDWKETCYFGYGILNKCEL